VSIAALLIGGGASTVQAAGADPVVAVVNGTEIRESDVRTADRELGKNFPINEARRDLVISFLADAIILSNVALKQNAVDEADIQRRTTFARNRSLMEKLLDVTGKAAVTEEAVRKAYAENIAKASTEAQLRLRSMQFRFSDLNDPAAVKEAEDKANAAYGQIVKGEDFAAVAAATSDDPAVKANGGDLGYLTRSAMGKEYADVAFALEVGAVSHPIRTQFGWHLLKVEDKRTPKVVDMEAVRDQLKSYVAHKAQLDLLAKLRSEAKVERRDQPADPK
jgi:parvulin-like peptidyl-prolyl isomerase